MIKLNNKNITYVALADTNNSIKAPKEIWYADSANSVKLVYRRKDALIEGEDYEKYHWLVGDNTAYIQGISYDLWDNHLEVKIGKLPNSLTSKYIGYPNFTIVFNVTGQAFQVIFRQNDSGYPHIADIYPYSSMPDTVTMDFYIENSLFYCNQNGVVKTNNPAQTAIESTWKSVTPQIYSAKMSYIREVLPNDTYRSNLIPCKLLKPVPKWLDANGIRRQVGECGMIDIVSGKFYGNVNSNGTFTVENYYERKEWLQGRNGAYIDTNYYPVVGTDIFSVHFHYDGILRNPSGQEQDVFGVNYTISDKNNFIRAYIQSDNRLACSYFQYAGFYPAATHSEEWDIVNLMIDDSYFKYIANGTEYSFDNNGIQFQVCPYSLFVFKNNDQIFNRNCYFHGDIFSFKITDTSSNTKMNLIPCTLTMDLPASMDANNIARTKGTSGMWDLVSDRFYGNVANSGTFKAVNLAEGVDYEVYDWLVGDGSAIIEVTGNIYRDTFSLVTIPTTTTNKRLLTSMGTTYDGNTTEYQIMIGGSSEFTIRHGIRINNRPTSIIKDFSGNYINNEYEITTYRDGDYYYGNINGVEYKNDMNFGEYQFDDKDIVINIYSNGFKLGNFNSGHNNLIPVKLLHSIPSKYDANGIARQAGECGMYDTVNDVFYGNVASSGTFSVSDDS